MDKVSVMGTLDDGYGGIRPHDDYYSDAMITVQAGLMLCVHAADCVPVVLLEECELLFKKKQMLTYIMLQ